MAEDFLAILAKEAEKNAKASGEPEALKPIGNNSDYLSQFATKAENEIKTSKKIPDDVLRVPTGFARGVSDVIDTGATAIGYLDQKIDEFLGGGGSKRNKAFKERISKEQKEYEDLFGSDIQANIGRVGGQIAATAPLMPVRAIQGINAAVKAAPTVLATGEKVAAPLVNRLTAAAATGGLGGAVYGGATSGSNDKSLASNVMEGLVTGAIGGPLITAVGAGASKLGSKIVGDVSETVADLAKRAEQLGIDLKPSQVSNSHFFKKLDQVTGWLPFSGQQALTDKQVSQFARAVSRTFGKDTDELSPQLLRTTRGELGKDYELIAAHTQINADNRLIKDLSKAYKSAQDILNKDELETFKKQLGYIAEKFKGGVMPGDAWQAMRHINEPMSRVIKGGGKIGQSVKDLQQAMDAAFNRSAPTDMQALLKITNARYKAIKTIEKLVEGSSDGTIRPLLLMRAVQKAPGGVLGSNDLGDIAAIGRQFFPTPADSGTPLGTGILNSIGNWVQHPLTAAAGAGAALKTGMAVADVAGAGLGLAANRAIREGITSKGLKDAILRSSKGETYRKLDRLSDAIVPHSAVLMKPSNPLRLTVSGKPPSD